MTKEYFINLANYNIWANNLVIDWLNNIDETQWNAELLSSFNSIALTTLHMVGAEKTWLERWQEIENPVFLYTVLKGSKEELINIWQQQSQNILNYITSFNEEDFQKQFSFKRLNGEENTMQYWQSFAHALNHATYHRGQLVTMLRQVGFTKVTSTDYLTFVRL